MFSFLNTVSKLVMQKKIHVKIKNNYASACQCFFIIHRIFLSFILSLIDPYSSLLIPGRVGVPAVMEGGLLKCSM